MAAARLQNLRLHNIYRSLTSNYNSFGRWRSTSISTSSSTLNTPINYLPFNGAPEIFCRSPLFSPSGFRCGEYGTVALPALNYRFLCTATTSANQSSGSVSGGTAEGTSNPGNSESSGGGSEKTGEQGKPVRGSPVSWMSLFLLLMTGATLIWYYDREKKLHIEEINSASKAVKQGPSVGKAAIGGPFNLVNHHGKSVTERDFFGKWTLVYFGFTHCPDICPDELQKLADAVDKIKEKSGIQVLPVFISVDPERDTVEQVREYVKEFHPNLIGLTGSVDEIKKTARAYRVYYMKTEEEGSDYLVDHSIVMYLMDPKMEFVKFFGKNNDAESLAEGVIKELKQLKK